jgi:polysaccharide pyruvyl transferase WcaK-like protein
MIYGSSAGPLDDPRSQGETVRCCFEVAEATTVRDRRAKNLLECPGVRRDIRVTADPALLIEHAIAGDLLLGSRARKTA